MLPRFYAPELTAEDEFTLPAEEAHHLIRVMRLGTGDQVHVFDGRGSEYRALVVTAVRGQARLRAIERIAVGEPTRVTMTVVQAVLKGASMDSAIRDATMMGAVRIMTLLTDHVDVKPAVAERAVTIERWRRLALSSAKQCRRATVPTIEQPRTFGQWLNAAPPEPKLLFVEPSMAVSPRPVKALLDQPVPERVSVLLGPEGGWSAREVDAALAASCIPVSLGRLTLRAESMPVAAMAALTAIWPG